MGEITVKKHGFGENQSMGDFSGGVLGVENANNSKPRNTQNQNRVSFS
jgi:hypothetical protein